MAEIEMDHSSLIISETDAKGVITFANDDFIRYSGYSWDELLGQPHNILRHQDMPKAAFADLWETIKEGKTWNGFVKNKTKRGIFTGSTPPYLLSLSKMVKHVTSHFVVNLHAEK